MTVIIWIMHDFRLEISGVINVYIICLFFHNKIDNKIHSGVAGMGDIGLWKM